MQIVKPRNDTYSTVIVIGHIHSQRPHRRRYWLHGKDGAVTFHLLKTKDYTISPDYIILVREPVEKLQVTKITKTILTSAFLLMPESPDPSIRRGFFFSLRSWSAGGMSVELDLVVGLVGTSGWSALATLVARRRRTFSLVLDLGASSGTSGWSALDTLAALRRCTFSLKELVFCCCWALGTRLTFLARVRSILAVLDFSWKDLESLWWRRSRDEWQREFFGVVMLRAVDCSNRKQCLTQMGMTRCL